MLGVRRTGFATGLTLAVLAASAVAQDLVNRPTFVYQGHNRIGDPKLPGGGFEFAFELQPAAASIPTLVEVVDGGVVIDTVFSGVVSGGAPPTALFWDGTDAAGNYVDTGAYTIRVTGGVARPLFLSVDVVRLGVTEIEFQDSAAGNDEWQMVYFKKGFSDGQFYATPAIHEYAATAGAGEVSDLDLNDGSPRPASPLHTATDEPVMDGSQYATDQYSYPAAYLAGAAPRLEVTFGDSATSTSGAAMGVGYPVTGIDLRLVAAFSTGAVAITGPIAPGGTAVVDGDPLTQEVDRSDVDVTWSWQYQNAAGIWVDVPGSVTTNHRFYTLFDAPKWEAVASGTQYTGPWVEVADYFADWKATLGIDTTTSEGVVETFIKGFVGQNGGIPTAIEGVIYDAYPLGGDGGATHYFNWGSWDMDLSGLLNGHAGGVYVNCTDNMGSSTTMLSMLGIDGMRPVRLGSMTLKAIWGIGAPAYTTSLWGSSHGFSYHHIVTRDNGVHVSDTCMQLDEDGNPTAIPGIPGWNHDRPWAGPGGYDDLSSYNPTTTSLESLPGLY